MKTADEIYQELLASFGERTGLEPREGCDLSARLYALAAQVYGLYVQADWVVRQAFPQTAEGEFLDRHAQLRGLERKPAAAAPRAMHQRDWEKTVKLSNGELYKGEGSPSRCSITNPVQEAMSRGARISMLTVPMMISLTNRQPEKGA